MAPSVSRLKFEKRLRREGENLLIELVQVIGFILVLFLGQLLVHSLFGGKKLFDAFPTEWLFEAGDVGLVACFSIRGCIRLFGEDL